MGISTYFASCDRFTAGRLSNPSQRYNRTTCGVMHSPPLRSNDTSNPGLPRLALEMATGSGKTVVMAMLIAWQVLSMQGDQPTYRDLWLRIREHLPRKGRKTEELDEEPKLPAELEGAIQSLYGNVGRRDERRVQENRGPRDRGVN